MSGTSLGTRWPGGQFATTVRNSLASAGEAPSGGRSACVPGRSGTTVSSAAPILPLFMSLAPLVYESKSARLEFLRPAAGFEKLRRQTFFAPPGGSSSRRLPSRPSLREVRASAEASASGCRPSPRLLLLLCLRTVVVLLVTHRLS